jgi:hypothetical protein
VAVDAVPPAPFFDERQPVCQSPSAITPSDLIGFSGKLGKAGKRPRFRLNTHQVQLLE